MLAITCVSVNYISRTLRYQGVPRREPLFVALFAQLAHEFGHDLALGVRRGSGSVRGRVRGLPARARGLRRRLAPDFDLATKTITPRLRAHPERTIAVTRDVYVFGHFFLVGAIVTLSAGLGRCSAGGKAWFAAAALVVLAVLVVAVAGDAWAPALALSVLAVALAGGACLQPRGAP
jgi:hypothetical protein